MNKKTKQELLDWFSLHIDDVTSITIKKDTVTLFVNGLTKGIISYQRIGDSK